MSNEDREILNLYVEESLEHLADIESDLLAVEKAGDKRDEKVVNRIFRAAHSIKGGAGYMGFFNVQELSHYIENVLDRLRKQEIQTDSTLISILLKAFDKLRELIQHIENSNNIDITAHTSALSDYSKIRKKKGGTEPQEKVVDIMLPDGKKVFTVPHDDIHQYIKEGKHIYVIEYSMDMKEGAVEVSKTLRADMPMLLKTGFIIETDTDFSPIGNLEEDLPDQIPVRVLYATIVAPDIGKSMFGVDESLVHTITRNFISAPYLKEDTASSESSALPEPAKPVQPAEKPPSASAEPPADNMPEAAKDTENTHITASSHTQTSLRVNIDLLDKLMNLAGELVLCRNQLLQSSSAQNLIARENAQQRIDAVTSELQETIMQTRMQSVGNIFNKFPRMVRDLSENLGKNINLSIEGKEVELDKTIIEAISDPLTHIVRNAVDHGIETPEIRKRMNKDPYGKINLCAYHEAGHVNIEVSDDGKGLDGEELAAKAIQKELISGDQVKSMTDKEKISLIFLPGFSTAENVTDVSGRGVGMDVVKTNIDKLGGTVEIDSDAGNGSVIRVKIPLTLAIIPSQIVYAGNERYAIPQVNLDELLIVSADQTKNRIEKVGNMEVVRLRGSLLPLLDLAEVLNIPKTYIDPDDDTVCPDRRNNLCDRRSKITPIPDPDDEDTAAAPSSDTGEVTREKKEYVYRQEKDRRFHAASDLYIAVVSAGNFKYGMVVKQLCDSEEIVVKPIGRHLKNCRGFAGATIMGDGRVALILDIAGIAHMGNIVSSETAEKITAHSKTETTIEAMQKDSVALLLFNNAEDEVFATPMSLVERIESVDKNKISYIGDEKFLKYRGGILPLFRIDEVAQVKKAPERDRFEVIVFKIAGKSIGLLTTPPVDGVEVTVDVDTHAFKQPGILGSALIHDQMILMVDIFEAVKTLKPEWYEEMREKQKKMHKKATILFAEDSTFLRNQVKGYIEDDGYHVIEAVDGWEAWEALNKHAEEIQAVVTDLDMPNMNGFELSEKIRSDRKFAHLPIIALTSLSADADITLAKKAGMNDYHIKLDRNKLLDSLSVLTESG